MLRTGFVSFVLSLKKRMYMYQFGQFAWTHTIILVIVVPSAFFVCVRKQTACAHTACRLLW